MDSILSMPFLPDHQLRVTATPALCDNSVKQRSGYLDVAKDRHLFFWQVSLPRYNIRH